MSHIRESSPVRFLVKPEQAGDVAEGAGRGGGEAQLLGIFVHSRYACGWDRLKGFSVVASTSVNSVTSRSNFLKAEIEVRVY